MRLHVRVDAHPGVMHGQRHVAPGRKLLIALHRPPSESR